MLDQYTPWVMGTYGDSAKTKTITSRKYARIVALLKATGGGTGGGGGSGGENKTEGSGGSGEPSGSEAAKFRLWVKSKGFHLGPPAGHVVELGCAAGQIGPDGTREILYLPTGTDKVRESCSMSIRMRRTLLTRFNCA